MLYLPPCMIGDSFPAFISVPFLSAEQCDEVHSAVMALRPVWTGRGHIRFNTLGAASYLDSPRGNSAYKDAAKAGNSILHAVFAPLLERVRLHVEETTQKPAFYDQERCALPGFHIFVLDGSPFEEDDVSKRAHFDLQSHYLLSGQVPSATLSFTLMITEPSGGASMEVWDLRYEELAGLAMTAVEYAARNPSRTLRYERGHLLVHDGLELHAIGRALVKAPVGERITLQGHAALLPEGWLLYW